MADARTESASLPITRIDFAKSLIRNVPDFPTPGIAFKDITPMLADAKALHIVLDVIAERFIGESIDAVVGIEARGFIFGGALAARLNAGFVPARKPGKLPWRSRTLAYATEYSTAELCMHEGSFKKGARALIVDDVLATGGTARAAADLARAEGAVVAGYAFVIELGFIPGRKKLFDGLKPDEIGAHVESVITY